MPLELLIIYMKLRRELCSSTFIWSNTCFTNISKWTSCRMMSSIFESYGIKDISIVCNSVGPRITCFGLSKVESPRRGVRYERYEKAFAFPCKAPCRYIILKSNRVRNCSQPACRHPDYKAYCIVWIKKSSLFYSLSVSPAYFVFSSVLSFP